MVRTIFGALDRRANIMTKHSSCRAARHLLALASVILLAGCIDSAEPILTDGQSLLGERMHLQFYALRDGAAHEPRQATFVWRGDRYVGTDGPDSDMGAFTLHAFEGADMIVQSMRPGKPTEYAIARKLADATYLIVAIDEAYADDATRKNYCTTGPTTACRVATREAVLAFARAAAAKPLALGGLALILADD
jgi:hypothetical protein